MRALMAIVALSAWLSDVPAGVLAVTQAAQAGAADGLMSGLASGPYARMWMLLEKTIFAVDVLTVDLRVDELTAQRFRRIAEGRQYSDRLATQIVEAALAANDVAVALEFQRGVSLNRWIEGVRDGLVQAARAGMIDEAMRRGVSEGLPRWFQAVAGRGFETGDQIRYRGYPDRLHTMLVTPGGEVLVDQTDPGSSPRVALLAGFLAPGTDFREPLVRSLLQP